MKSVNLIRAYSRLLVCLAVLLLAVACGSTSPTSPDPSPTPEPSPSPSPGPSPSPSPSPSPGPAALRIVISPNPVRESGAAVSGCGSNVPYRWVWDQVLENTGGSTLILSVRVNYVDGARLSTAQAAVTLAPGQKHTQPTAYCSGANTAHNFRTDWEANVGTTYTGPTVELLKP